MEKVEKYVLLFCETPDDADRLQEALKEEFHAVHISTPADFMNHSDRASLLLLDQGYFKVHSLSTLSGVLENIELPVILRIDPKNADDYEKILQKLDITHAIIRHDGDLPLLKHTINRAIDDFSYKQKMQAALFQLKKRLDEVKDELEKARGESDRGPQMDHEVDLLEEIVFIFKRGEIDLPSHPKLSFRFKELVDKGASLQEIADLLRRDAAISSKLIAVSNSPIYRGISNNKTLEQAIGRLGLDTTKQYVEVIQNRTLYMSKQKKIVHIIEKLWDHALSCAYACQITAQRLELALPEDAFTLGLLHDIGKLVILQTVGKLQQHKKLGENIDQSEVFATMEAYHGKFGASLMKLWKFSEDFYHVAAYHNNLSEADPISKSLLVVHFSNQLVKSMGYGLSEYDRADLEEAQSTTLLKLTLDDIQDISDQVKPLMDEFSDFFN